MASLRKLNRRLHVWRRYARRTAWNPRITRPAWCGPNTAIPPGHTRAWDARELERERRQCLTAYGEGWSEHDDNTRFDCLGSCCRDELVDESDWFDDEGYPWPGAIVETGLTERGLL